MNGACKETPRNGHLLVAGRTIRAADKQKAVSNMGIIALIR